MHRYHCLAQRVPLVAIICCMFILLGIPGIASADGPNDAGSLTGVTVVNDTDSGNGEQWGRAGGRDITYSVSNPGDYAALSWGIVNGTVPAAAFDNDIDGLNFAINPNPNEYMTYNPAGSDTMNGVAQWTGEAEIQEVVPVVTRTLVPTRFTLTVTDGAGVPLAFVMNEVDPGIDVLADTGGSFTVNLFFEAQAPNSNVWEPILDMFDRLDTGINADGWAHTRVETGFYYELAGQGGLTLEEHDANISGQLADVKSDTGYLRIEAVNRLIGLAEDLVMLKNQVNMLPTDLNVQLPGNLATGDDVNAVGEQLTQMFLTLFGVLPCPPEAAELCDSAILINDLATQVSVDMVRDDLDVLEDKIDALQTALESVSAMGQVDVQVVELSDSSKSLRRWLVTTTRQGQLVDVDMFRVLAMTSVKNAPATYVDVTMDATLMPLSSPGLYELAVQVSDKKAEAFQIEVELDDGMSGVRGTALVSTK